MELLLIGDVMLGRTVNDALRTRTPEYPWGDTLPLIRETDVRICNLECALSDGGSPARKEFTFRSDAKNVAVLEVAGMDAVTLGNNHALDYGAEALSDTIGILDQEGIWHAGAGENLADAQALAPIRAGDATAGLLSVTDTEEPGWAAEAERAGIWFVPININDPRALELLEKVRKAKPMVDTLIVSLHWGSNWGYEPEAGHRIFAHTLIDAGVDIVFGHSAHVFRGIEIYNGKPIIYSAGNFIDDYAIDKIERNDESFIFVVRVYDGRIERVHMYPTVIENFQARLADGERANHIAAHMKELCQKLNTSALWSGTEGALNIDAQT